MTRLCLPAHCAEFVVVQGLFGLYQALCPPEGIIAVAEKDIQVISMPGEAYLCGGTSCGFLCVWIEGT